MSEFSEDFVKYLQTLDENNRGAIAVLRRSLGFAPGAYPPAYPCVERFAAKGDDTPWQRQALYLTAGLFAMHPKHAQGQSLAAVLARVMSKRNSPSIEKRFVALLATEAEELPDHLRQVVSLLAADKAAIDYAALCDDLRHWLNPYGGERRDDIRQRWARAFYRAAAPQPEADAAAPSDTQA